MRSMSTSAGRRARAVARLVSGIVLCAPCHVAAQAEAPAALEPSANAMVAVRLRPDEHIALDGTLDDPAWRRAPVFDRFVEHEPDNGAKPAGATRVQILYDRAAIYVGVTALDDHPERIRAPLVRHDGVNRTQDSIVVYVDAIGKRQSAQIFGVNAAGSATDGMQIAADDLEDLSPDFDFDAASARNEHGYTAVLRIPFASLRYASDAQAGWRILVSRRVPRDQFSVWLSAPIALDATTVLAALQPLQGVEPPGESGFLTLRPSITVRHDTQRDPGQPADGSNGVQGSLDVKWRALPELVVDGTLKPDFSQVELDVLQLKGNSDFALYLPEKRPFFFEGSDLLRSPSDALYTRSFNAPRWGLRSTWRGAALSGTALAVDDQGGGATLLPYAYGTDSAAQPASRTLAARARGDADEEGGWQLGGLFAARRYEGDGGDNVVAGPDVAWRVDDALRLSAQWLHSQTTAQPLQEGAASDSYVLRRGAATRGDSITLKATLLTERTETIFTGQDIGPGFRDDTGFVNQVGFRGFDTHQSYGFRSVRPLNELWLTLNEKFKRDRRDGATIEASLTPNVWFTAPANTEGWIEYHGLSKLRVASGGRLLSEHYWAGELKTSPASWCSKLDVSLSLGRMADSDAGVARPGGQLKLALETRPLPALEVVPSVWAAWLRRGEVLTYRETASQLLGVLHVDARQSLRLITQRSTLDRKAEPGVAADRDSGLTTSLTYAWRRSMGTVLYVGAQRAHSGVGADNLARGTSAFVKLQVDVDEARTLFDVRPARAGAAAP